MADRFALSVVVSTPGAINAFLQTGEEPISFVYRHAAGDWGELDAEDREENERSVDQGCRIFSSYRLSDGTKFTSSPRRIVPRPASSYPRNTKHRSVPSAVQVHLVGFFSCLWKVAGNSGSRRGSSCYASVMDVRQILEQLTQERDQLNEAILSLESLVAGQGRRRGRPPARLKDVSPVENETPKRRGRPAGIKNKR
jgi:hypothetical protein